MLEKLNLGKQGSDLCSSSVTQTFVAAYFQELDAGGEPGWKSYVERLRVLYRRRRDVMLAALEEHFGEHATWTRPRGGLFIWATLDEHRHHRPASRAERGSGVRAGPCRLHGRPQRASSMRLNFAGVPDEDIREGIRRIGQAVREQLGLLGSLTGKAAAGAAEPTKVSGTAAAPSVRSRWPTWWPCPSATTQQLPVAVAIYERAQARCLLKGGRSLERSVSLRSGAQVQDGLQRLGHEVIPIDVGPELVADLLASEADVAFIALHGRYGEDGTVQGLLEAVGLPYTGSGPAACMRATNKVLAKHLMHEAGYPRPISVPCGRRR